MKIINGNVYNCKTKQDAKAFISECERQGIQWIKSCSNKTYWDKYKENTCYHIENEYIYYGSYELYLKSNYKIIEYTMIPDEIMNSDKTIFYAISGNEFYVNALLKAHNQGYTFYDTNDYFELAKLFQIYLNKTVVVLGENKIAYIVEVDHLNKKAQQKIINYSKTDLIDKFQVGDVVKHEERLYTIVSKTYKAIYIKNIDFFRSADLFKLQKYEHEKVNIEKYLGKKVISTDNNIYFITSALGDFTYSALTENGEYICLIYSMIKESVDCYYDYSDIKVGDYILVPSRKNNIYEVKYAGKDFIKVELDDGYSYVLHNTEVKKCTITPMRKINYCTVVDDNRLKKLTDEVMSVLAEHNYSEVEYESVLIFMKEWNKQKGHLANLLRKHKNWDEENLCVTDVLENVNVLSENKIDDIMEDFLHFIDNDDAIKILKYNYLKTCLVSGYADKTLSVFIEDAKKFYNIKLSCNEGTKMTRLIRDICCAFGVDKQDNFEKEYAKLSDALNKTKVKNRACLSVNPIDYLLMSNGNSWSSCQLIDGNDTDRCYQSGTMSYALDEVTLVYYTVSKNAKANFSIQPKIKRQLFCYYNAALLQSRMYPSYTNLNANQDAMEWVSGIISNCLGEHNFVTQNEKFYNLFQKYFEENEDKTHYPDYTFSKFNPKIALLDNNFYGFYAKGIIGASPICPVCGNRHGQKSTLCCEECYDANEEE